MSIVIAAAADDVPDSSKTSGARNNSISSSAVISIPLSISIPCSFKVDLNVALQVESLTFSLIFVSSGQLKILTIWTTIQEKVGKNYMIKL